MKKTVLKWSIVILLGAFVAISFLRGEPVSKRETERIETTASPPATLVGGRGIHIYSTAWGLTLAEDGSGFYNDLAALFLNGLRTPLNYDIRPYRRAKALFLRDDSSCLYPSNIELLQDGGEIASTSSFIDTTGLLQVKVYLFSSPDTTPPTSMADVRQKSIAYAMGSRIPFFLKDANADFIAVANESDKARMLLTGRVDMMTAAMPDAQFVFDNLGQPLPPFDPSYELNDTQIRITCHDTPATRAFADAFNKRAKALLEDGKLKAFFTNNKLAPALYMPSPSP